MAEYIMEDDIFKEIVHLATVTEKNILKARECYISYEYEEYEKMKKEILSDMSKILDEKTKFFISQKEIALAEIEKFKELKYKTLRELEMQDKRYSKHIFIEKYIPISSTLMGSHMYNRRTHNYYRRCIICGENIYRKINNSKNIIPKSIYKKSKNYGEYSLEEINTKLNSLYLRYQILSQVSYNICCLFGHIRKHHSASECECPRCEMKEDTYYNTRRFNPVITLSEIDRKSRSYVRPRAQLQFLHLDYGFDTCLPVRHEWKYLLLLDRKAIIKELCVDINSSVKEEDIVLDDEEFMDTINSMNRKEKEKTKTRQLVPNNKMNKFL